MHYGNIKNCDVANGEGVRVTLFVSGCTNRCEQCFQPETWDFSYGEEFTREVEDKIIEMLASTYINGLTVLGGEPFEPSNQRALLPFLTRVRAAYPDKNIWAFTGFTFEELKRDGSHPRCECTDGMLSLIDVLVDGRYEHAKRNLSLKFRGSSNQRLIDVPKTLEADKVVLWDE